MTDQGRAESMTVCNDCNASTSGRCWRHTPSVIEMSASLMLAQQCASGFHAWTPWIGLPPENPTRFVTICGREGCAAEKQYDL